jgi:choline dehydrogenase
LTIVTGAHVTGVNFDGNRATGVTYALGQDAEHVAAGEVILSMGAIGSPHILMLSGVGPAAHLQERGIKCRHDLPGVGQNLLDHAGGPGVHILLKDPEKFGFPIPDVVQSIKEFEETGGGPLASIGVDAGAFVRLTEAEEYPNGQLICAVGNMHADRGADGPKLRFGGYVARTYSQGSVTLASASPFDRPLVDPNYLSDPLDLQNYVEMVRFQFRIADHPVFDPVRAEVQGPGRETEEIIAAIRQGAETCWHLSSTCRMGVDNRAVVDPELGVHGLEGLRVVDVSIFPTMTSSNTNAPTMMVAEKGADLALGIKNAGI